jgi:hypothetical protein
VCVNCFLAPLDFRGWAGYVVCLPLSFPSLSPLSPLPEPSHVCVLVRMSVSVREGTRCVGGKSLGAASEPPVLHRSGSMHAFISVDQPQPPSEQASKEASKQGKKRRETKTTTRPPPPAPFFSLFVCFAFIHRNHALTSPPCYHHVHYRHCV